MEKPLITPATLLVKSIEIYNEGKKYICKIKIEDELIQTDIYLDKELKYKGKIFLEKIQSQIKAFFEYNINEIFEEINQLKSQDFSIIKEYNKYKLKIKFIILRKEKNIIIDLNDNKLDDDKNNNYEKIIKDKDNIILELKEKIKNLEEKDNIILELKEKIKNLEEKDNNILELKEKIKNIEEKDNIILQLREKIKKLEEKSSEKEKNDKNKNVNKSFDINSKNFIHKLNFHSKNVNCFAILNDGRLVSGSGDSTIIIYNKTTYQPDLIIREHKDKVLCITKLDSGILASCSYDRTIKLFNIKENNYELLQTLNNHTSNIYKIIEIKNKYLISCSSDKSIIFYTKDKSEYIQDFKISTNLPCYSVIQTKENEICYSESENIPKYNICFYDLKKRKIKSSMHNISISGSLGTFNIISKNLLVIGGERKITIIDINKYKLVRIIEVTDSKWIFGFCMINENIFLTGDNNGTILQWKIDKDNLVLISNKEKAHDNCIGVLIKIGEDQIASGSDDQTIKIW